MSDTYRFSSVCVCLRACVCVRACARVCVQEKERGIGTTERKERKSKRCWKRDLRKIKKSAQKHLQRRKQDRNSGAAKGLCHVAFYSFNVKRKWDPAADNSSPAHASTLF